MHDPIGFRAGGLPFGRRILESLEICELSTEHGPVKIESFLAVAAEAEIWVYGNPGYLLLLNI